jgi:hypothetical protein
LLGTFDGDSANALALGADKALYVAGYTVGDLEGQKNKGDNPNTPTRDAFVSRINSKGAVGQTWLVGTAKGQDGQKLTVGIDGALYLAGTTGDKLANDDPALGGNDVFLQKWKAPTADLTPPTLEIKSDRTALEAGGRATIFFGFSEAVPEFDSEMISVNGGARGDMLKQINPASVQPTPFRDGRKALA